MDTKQNLGFQTRIGRKNLSVLLLLFVVPALCMEIIAGITNGEGLTWDFAVFYDAGHKVLAGEVQNIYDNTATIEGSAPLGKRPFHGTPLSAILYAPFALFSPGVALVLFKVQNTLANLAAIFLLYWQSKRFGEASFRGRLSFLVSFLIVVALYQPFWEIYHIGGQTTPSVLLLLALSLLWHTRNKIFLAAFCFCIAVTIKPAFVIALALLALLSGRRFAIYTTGIGLGFAATSVVWTGWSLHEAFLERILAQMPSGWWYNSSLTVAIDNFLTKYGTPQNQYPLAVLSTIVRFGVTGLFMWFFVRSRSRVPQGPPRRHLDFLIAISACLLLMPTVWEHYLALLFIPLSYCLAVHRSMPRKAEFILGLIFLASIAQNVKVVPWLESIIYFNTPLEFIVAGFFKSVPLVLISLFFIGFHGDFVNTYTSREWVLFREEEDQLE